MSGKSREDFLVPTVRALAARAGYRCSFPGCDDVTSGPSDESSHATSNTGTACHIVAAAEGKSARRKNPKMPPEERAAIENGVWMCATHGRLIDNDENTFSVPMLTAWRDIAEARAALRQRHGQDVSLDDLFNGRFLIEETLRIRDPEQAGELIEDLFKNCFVSQLWGKQPAMDIRDVLVELSINALDHGGAQLVRVKVSPVSIELIDDGGDFNAWKQIGNSAGTGGQEHVGHVVSTYDQCLAFEHKRISGLNVHSVCLIRNVDDVRAFTPCVAEFPFSMPMPDWDGMGCENVYLVIRSLYISNFARYLAPIIDSVPAGKKVVIVTTRTSDFVVGRLRKSFPSIRVICPLTQ